MRVVYKKGIPRDVKEGGLTLSPGGDISFANMMLTLFLAGRIDAHAKPRGEWC